MHTASAWPLWQTSPLSILLSICRSAVSPAHPCPRRRSPSSAARCSARPGASPCRSPSRRPGGCRGAGAGSRSDSRWGGPPSDMALASPRIQQDPAGPSRIQRPVPARPSRRPAGCRGCWRMRSTRPRGSLREMTLLNAGSAARAHAYSHTHSRLPCAQSTSLGCPCIAAGVMRGPAGLQARGRTMPPSCSFCTCCAPRAPAWAAPPGFVPGARRPS